MGFSPLRAVLAEHFEGSLDLRDHLGEIRRTCISAGLKAAAIGRLDLAGGPARRQLDQPLGFLDRRNAGADRGAQPGLLIGQLRVRRRACGPRARRARRRRRIASARMAGVALLLDDAGDAADRAGGHVAQRRHVTGRSCAKRRGSFDSTRSRAPRCRRAWPGRWRWGHQVDAEGRRRWP